jgi:hypothetical protein
MNDNWAGARTEFETNVLPKLRVMGKEIAERSKQGCREASDVINYYNMLYRSFDPVAFILLEESLKKYEAL